MKYFKYHFFNVKLILFLGALNALASPYQLKTLKVSSEGKFPEIFEYDTSGQQIQKGDRKVTWGLIDKPKIIHQNQTKERFTYGIGGKLYLKANSASRTLYVGGMEYEYDADGNLVSKVVRLPHGAFSPIAFIRFDSNDDKAYRYLIKDHLGSVLAQVNDEGTIDDSSTMRYSAWGKSVTAQGGAQNTQNFDPGFTGHRSIDAMSLIYMNARFYDPEAGQFLSPDIFAHRARKLPGLNPYSYIYNSPLNGIDPSGWNVYLVKGTWRERFFNFRKRNDFKKIGRAINSLRSNSVSFNDLYTKIDNDKNINLYIKPSFGGESHVAYQENSVTSAQKNLVMHINVRESLMFENGIEQDPRIAIAHEFRHAEQILFKWRDSVPESIYDMERPVSIHGRVVNLRGNASSDLKFSDLYAQILNNPKKNSYDYLFANYLIENDAVDFENKVVRELGLSHMTRRHYADWIEANIPSFDPTSQQGGLPGSPSSQSSASLNTLSPASLGGFTNFDFSCCF